MEKALTIADRSVTSVAFSPDGSMIAATCRRWPGDQEGGVMLWDARSGLRMVDRLQDIAEGSEGELAFSPDGQTLAVEYSDDHGSGVVLWDVPLRRRLGKRPLEVAEGDVTSLAFSPDGKALAVGFRNIGFREAGRISRGGVVLFDIDPKSWKERAGRIANRNLTREEWREYLPDTPYRATFAHLPPTARRRVGPTIVACDRTEGCIGGQTVSSGPRSKRLLRQDWPSGLAGRHGSQFECPIIVGNCQLCAILGESQERTPVGGKNAPKMRLVSVS